MLLFYRKSAKNPTSLSLVQTECAFILLTKSPFFIVVIWHVLCHRTVLSHLYCVVLCDL